MLIAAGKPVFPLRLRFQRDVQQNSFGARREIQSAIATFAPSLFRPTGQTLTLALVTSGERVEIEILPPDLMALAR